MVGRALPRLVSLALLPHLDVRISGAEKRSQVRVGQADVFEVLEEVRKETVVGESVYVKVEVPISRHAANDRRVIAVHCLELEGDWTDLVVNVFDVQILPGPSHFVV